MAQVGPKAALSNFYQKCRVDLPTYDCTGDQKAGLWTCVAVCAPASVNGHDIPSTTHSAVGRNKKDATNAAAALALEQLAKTEAYQSLLAPEDLWDVIIDVLDDKVGRKDVKLA